MRTSPHRTSRRAATLAVACVAASILIVAAPAPGAPRAPKTEASDLLVQSKPVESLSKQIALPMRANMIGFTYRGSSAQVKVRVHEPGGRWGPWQTLGSSDIGPDAWTGEGNDRVATEPLWVDLADRILLRMDGVSPVRDVRMHAINTLGDARPRTWWRSILGFLGSAPRALIPQTRLASASPAVPRIVSRAGWGADERWRRCCPRYAPTVEVAFIHHTVSPNNYSQAEAPGLIRAIYRYHRFNLDYDDIAYNFIVDRFGTIYEGRYGGIDKPLVAAHTEGMNTKTTGIALLGTFSSSYPSGPMVVSLMIFLAWKLDVHHIPAWGVVPMTSGGSAKLRPGQQVWMNRISGHRDAQSTECPGTKMYYQLPRIRETVMKWGQPKFFMNSTPRVLRVDGDDKDESNIDLTVWFSGEVNWKIDFADRPGNARASFTGRGSKASVSWDGRDASTKVPAADGAGTMTVQAWDDNNRRATQAVVPVSIVTTHPFGTILRTADTSVWIDDGGTSRAVGSDAVFASWFRSNETVQTGPAEPSRYTAGLPLGFRDGTVAKTPDGVYHFLSGGQRREFSSQTVFDTLGYTDAGSLAVPQAEIDALPAGAQITDVTIHPDATLILDPEGRAWVIAGGTRRAVPSTAVRRSWYRDAEAVPATAGDVALPQGSDVLFRPGTLLRTPSGHLWIASQGTRRLFLSEDFFDALGYSTKAVVDVSWDEIGILPYGTPVG